MNCVDRLLLIEEHKLLLAAEYEAVSNEFMTQYLKNIMEIFHLLDFDEDLHKTTCK